MSNLATLSERIASHSLTPTERRIADVVLGDSTVVAFGTVAEVAELVDASGPTVVRFATKLGFDGYSALQADARRVLSERLKRPIDRIRNIPEEGVGSRARDVAVAGVEAAFESVPDAMIERLAGMISGVTGQVWIVASESSAAALVLASGLRLLRPRVRHLKGSIAAISADLTDAAPGDIAVAIDFRRYESAVVDITNILARQGATVIAITDGAFSPIVTQAEAWCEVDVPAIGPFDSALPSVAVVEAILAHVTHQLAEQATERIDAAEALWAGERIFHDSNGTA